MKLRELSKDELQREVLRFNSRIANYAELVTAGAVATTAAAAVSGAKLSGAGSVQDLIRRLTSSFETEAAVLTSILAASRAHAGLEQAAQALHSMLLQLLRCCVGFDEFRPGQL